MKVVVALLVYNRFENLKHWLECWKLCDKENTEFRVIHNGGAGSQRFYNVFMDTKSHTLTVCDAGAQDGATEVQEAEATSIFVEARQG